MAHPKIGEKATDFQLTSTDLKIISRAEYAGKSLVLLFFPLAYSGGCIKEMCLVRDSYDQYNSLDAEVLGISVDSPFVLRKFATDYNLQFPLASDFNRKMCKDYGVMYEGEFVGMTGFSRRASFIIDANGIIRYKEICDSNAQPDFEKIKETLSALSLN